MRIVVVVVLSMVLSGCYPSRVTPEMRARLVEFGVASAMAVTVIDHPQQRLPDDDPVGCVSGCKCNGTGRVKSGDRNAEVGCDCPDTCDCKRNGTGDAKPAVCPRCLNSRKVLSGRKIVPCEACQPGCSGGSCPPTK